MYEPRYYRNPLNSEKLASFEVCYQHTDLWIALDRDCKTKNIEKLIFDKIKSLRALLDKYCSQHDEIITSFSPLDIAKYNDAPAEIKQILEDCINPNVGPLACIAGLFAQKIGKFLLTKTSANNIIVENGGDLFVSASKPTTIKIDAGNSAFSDKIGLVIPENLGAVGVCCSSGKRGHSTSLGKADAVVIVCKSAPLADAYATSFCNRIKSQKDLQSIIDEIQQIPEIISAVLICEDQLAVAGSLELTKLT